MAEVLCVGPAVHRVRGRRLLAIDPGPMQSAGVLYDLEAARPIKWAKAPNEEILAALDGTTADLLAVEMVACYGMAVGAEVFDTCRWVGRFVERWLSGWRRDIGPDPLLVYRREVKLHLCGSARAKDSNIRAALIDRFGPGRELAVGRKATPGPLHGIKADCWAALAVAITAAETRLGSGGLAA